MTTPAWNSVTPAPVPEFDAVVLGRSFASQRAATRLRDEVRLSVHEIDNATSARYDDVDHRWEIRYGRTVVARAKFTIDGHGDIATEGRDGIALDSDSHVVQGFPNLFRAAGTRELDTVGYAITCIGYMRAHGHDYVEPRRQPLVSDDPFPELSFDRPTPHMWTC